MRAVCRHTEMFLLSLPHFALPNLQFLSPSFKNTVLTICPRRDIIYSLKIECVWANWNCENGEPSPFCVSNWERRDLLFVSLTQVFTSCWDCWIFQFVSHSGLTVLRHIDGHIILLCFSPRHGYQLHLFTSWLTLSVFLSLSVFMTWMASMNAHVLLFPYLEGARELSDVEDVCFISLLTIYLLSLEAFIPWIC